MNRKSNTTKVAKLPHAFVQVFSDGYPHLLSQKSQNFSKRLGLMQWHSSASVVFSAGSSQASWS